jgi:hypothetical protein
LHDNQDERGAADNSGAFAFGVSDLAGFADVAAGEPEIGDGGFRL